MDKLKLGAVDKRLYAVAVILVMLLILIFILISDNNEGQIPQAASNATVTETDDKVTINLDRPVTDDEKKDVEGFLRDRYQGKQVEINIPLPYDENNDDSLEFLKQKANNEEPLPEEYQPKPTDTDPPGAYN